ncbi:SAC3/GANP [Gracilaria domingensis]|nr:SAC3/GANP [Gracilaria domingensis]
MSSARGRRYQPRGGTGRRGRRGRRGSNRGRPGAEQNSFQGSQRPAAASDKTHSIDEEYVQQLRDRNRNRFSSGAASEPSSVQRGSKESSPIHEHKKNPCRDHFVHEQNLEQKSLSSANNVETRAASSRRALPAKIGVGRATGVSRVPDAALSESSELVQYNLKCLEDRIERLLRQKQTVLEIGERELPPAATENVFAEWEAVHGAFRQLTMSITASTKPEVKRLAIPIYESAADASLYGGNLSFYLSCQTRLLKELYAELPLGQRRDSRYSEFIGYSLLYFGVFQVDDTEIAQLMRNMDYYTTKVPSVKLAFSILSAVRNRDGKKVFALYKRCSVSQRVLVFPALESIRRELLNVLIRAYLQLSKTKTASLLGMRNEKETLALIASERPDLAAQVTTENEEYPFRISV